MQELELWIHKCTQQSYKTVLSTKKRISFFFVCYAVISWYMNRIWWFFFVGKVYVISDPNESGENIPHLSGKNKQSFKYFAKTAYILNTQTYKYQLYSLIIRSESHH